MKENEPSREMVREELAFADVFLNRRDVHALQMDDGSYVCVRRPLSADLVTRHLDGRLTLGVYCLDEGNRGRWSVLDADDGDKWARLVSLSRELQGQGVPSYLELSRRGGHLWLFTAEPIRGRTLLAVGRALARKAQVEVEVFPKGEHAEGPGSLVRLPLGVHRVSGKRYPFVTPDGQRIAETPSEQVALLGTVARVPAALLADLLAEAPAPSAPRPVFRASPVVEHLRTLDIYDFVRRYVPLTENGKGHCPFHQDEHMSFSVNRMGNYWHCFAGCGGGDVISFWAKWQGISRGEAIRELMGAKP
jgi:hypothetical protein